MRQDPIYDEVRLFRRIAAGDVEAFRTIFDAYRQRLYAYIARLSKSHEVAEEVTQDVFMQIWTHRARLEDIDRPDVFIHVAARNRMIDYLRKIAHRQDLVRKIGHRMAEGRSFIDELMDYKASQRLIDEALNGVSQQKQTIFHLSRQDGLTHREIGQRLGLSENTVKNNLVEVLRHIRHYLRKHENGGLALVMLLMMSR